MRTEKIATYFGFFTLIYILFVLILPLLFPVGCGVECNFEIFGLEIPTTIYLAFAISTIILFFGISLCLWFFFSKKQKK